MDLLLCHQTVKISASGVNFTDVFSPTICLSCACIVGSLMFVINVLHSLSWFLNYFGWQRRCNRFVVAITGRVAGRLSIQLPGQVSSRYSPGHEIPSTFHHQKWQGFLLVGSGLSMRVNIAIKDLDLARWTRMVGFISVGPNGAYWTLAGSFGRWRPESGLWLVAMKAANNRVEYLLGIVYFVYCPPN